MAKGDSGRAQTQINNQSQIAQNSQDAMMNTLGNSQQGFQNNYNAGAQLNLGDYNNIMNGYNSIYNGGMNGAYGAGGSGGAGGIGDNSYGGYQQLANGGYAGWDPLFRGAFSQAIGGFGDFANNGGFSQQNIQDIRARSVAPMRATYANAQNELDRNRTLSGGGTNYAAASAKMNRDLAYGLGDAATNAEAQIAQMQQQGKLAGLQGLTSTGNMGQGLSTNIDQLNLQAMLAGLSGMTGIDQSRASAAGASSAANLGAQMDALGGMTRLYGTTPGLINTMGDQLLNSNGQLLQGQGLQNQISGGLMGNQIQKSQIPGDFQQGLQTAGQLAGMGSGLITGAIGFPKVGGYLGGGGNSTGAVSGIGGAAPNPADRHLF